MRGILSTLSGSRRRSDGAAERQRLLELAAQMHMELRPFKAVGAALLEAGASPADAEAINVEAVAFAEDEIAATVSLPASGQLPFNYYFLLGVTPKATDERIRQAYRRKAKEVHPDTHAQDFTTGQWNQFMAVLTDASQVLTDPLKRRAYDIFWRRRSLEVAAQYRRAGERRGDWETRYLWDIAEMGEREEGMVPLIEQLRTASIGSPERLQALGALRQSFERYEGALIEIRTQTRVLPEHLTYFSDRARIEMQRKERLVKSLRALLHAAREATIPADGPAVAALAEAALDVLREIRQAQHSFDLVHARSHI
jgi:curved DNA-binding protein CbpA